LYLQWQVHNPQLNPLTDPVLPVNLAGISLPISEGKGEGSSPLPYRQERPEVEASKAIL
jgi:hypothetical protein